jgi:hypothetical protein
VIFAIIIIATIVAFMNPHFISNKNTNTLTKNTNEQEDAYTIRESLLTPTETQFYQELKQAVDNRFIIFAKIRVADILVPEKGLSKSHWQSAFNKISAKHFDFVLCNSENLKVEVVIKLDDKSNLKSNRIDRDNFLTQAVHSSGLRILRFPVRYSYSVLDIKSKILEF